MARLLTDKGIDPRRITVIPNWPDIDLGDTTLRASWKRRRTARHIRGARPFRELFRDERPKFRVLYAGNLGRAHPIQTILDAAEMLAEDCPEVEFLFVGDGPGQDRLAQERARRGLGNIRLLPFQPAEKLREVLEGGDLHIVSMRHEAAGMLVPCKLYSAFAVKRPCLFVGPMHAEAAKVVSDFQAGAVIPQGQPAMLAQSIAHFMRDGKAWFHAQEGAIEAGRVFTPDESIRAWMQRAHDVIAHPPL
jgi:glycosyltransferase involved in cell wall biosynthesis